MPKKCTLFLLSLLLTIYSCQPEGKDSPNAILSSLLKEIKAKFAPDKRTAIWEITPLENQGELLLLGKTNLPAAKAQLEMELSAKGISWVDSIQVLPASTLKEDIYGIVNLSAANIRSEPAHSAELATQTTLGTILKIWDKSGDWYRVQTPDGYLGWLDPGGFQPINSTILDKYRQSDRVIYLPDMGFSFSQADDKSPRVSDLLAGNILVRLGKTGRFTKVSYPDGRIAYIPSKELMDWDTWLQSREPTAINILATAKKMLGRPYLWGGTSGKAFDCSGFTKTVFYLNGLVLPRDASQQIQVGLGINTTSIADFEPGDLLFFGRAPSSDQKEKITHVAIYMGEDKIIHASGSVKIESLNPEDKNFAPDRLTSLVRATRPLQTPEKYGVEKIADSDWY